MKKLLGIISLVIVLCFTYGCCQDESPGVMALSDEDIATIKAYGPAINEAMLAGDWQAFFENLSDDFVMLPPNNPAIKGRAAFEEWFTSMVVDFTECNYQFDLVEGYGDLAYATATYTETFSLAGVENPVYDEGKILMILRKQPDGSWLFSTWMWASDLPLQ
jgi:ketosteroid isomerase-like protein